MKLQKQDIEPLLADFKQGVKKLYGNRLDAAILFGSYARGEARDDSDVDILLVLKDKQVKPFHEIDILTDLIFDLNMAYFKLVSVVPVAKKQFKEQFNPLFINVRKEGQLI